MDRWPPGLAGELVWDDGNERHATRHGVSREEIDGMYDLGEWIVEPDPQGRPDQGRLVGPTPAGRLITVAVEWLPMRHAYRPISAWDAEAPERRKWRRDYQGRD